MVLIRKRVYAMPFARSLLAAPAMLAALAMTATPVAAAPLPAGMQSQPVPGAVGWRESAGVQHQYRRWHHRRDRDVDGGDIVAGVLIIGAIAAIASAVSKNNDRYERYPATDRLPPEPYRDRYRSGDGLGNAADMCVDEIARERRVENVDQVRRLASGWIVTGTTFEGQEFTCTIDQTGWIDAIEYGGEARSDGYADGYDFARDGAAVNRQYDDDRYAAERARLTRAGATDDALDEPQPAYPGGPLPGDEDRPLYEGEAD